MTMMILWVALIAFGLSLMTQIVNKLVINEKQVDQNREDIKKYQKELKGMDPKSKEFQEIQDKLLDKNFWIMKQQFRPMMFTFLPYIIVFYFLSSMLAYSPIAVGSVVDMQITGIGTIQSDCLNLNTAVSGKYASDVTIGTEDCSITVDGTELNMDLIGSQNIRKFDAENLKITIKPPEKEYIKLPLSLPLVGNSLGWLGTFIFSSLISSLFLTKVLKGRYLRKWD